MATHGQRASQVFSDGRSSLPHVLVEVALVVFIAHAHTPQLPVVTHGAHSAAVYRLTAGHHVAVVLRSSHQHGSDVGLDLRHHA